MDLGAWGPEKLNWHFFSGILNIIFINLVLSGDNAVIIAMAVRPLTRRQRRFGIGLGAGAAVHSPHRPHVFYSSNTRYRTD